MGRKIAIVEDEEAIRENYAVAFRRQGYDVRTYADRPRALEAFEERLPDLAIVDVGLGDEVEGGFELCRLLRGISESLPIIFLTARDSDLDTISGLRLGADDYLSKTVSLPHLLARVAALLRRVDALKSPRDAAQVLERGSLELDVLDGTRITDIGDRTGGSIHGRIILASLSVRHRAGDRGSRRCPVAAHGTRYRPLRSRRAGLHPAPEQAVNGDD